MPRLRSLAGLLRDHARQGGLAPLGALRPVRDLRRDRPDGRRPSRVQGRPTGAAGLALVALVAIGLSAPLGTMTDRLAAGVNAFRGSNGLAPIPGSSRLDSVAQTRTDDMAARGYFSHTSPTGETVLTLLDARYPGWWAIAGENLAWNAYPETNTAEAAVDAWIDSPGHRDLMLGDWDRLGTGSTRAADGRWYHALVVVVLAAPPRPTPAPTPRATPRPTPRATPRVTPAPTAAPTATPVPPQPCHTYRRPGGWYAL